ncbi:cadherin-related family member 4 [Rhineura floridana]|uniref:cadherin-related family member 4 n=1 Tax=Rhineura floridana TaxID=261503 RepID=UPI002AC8900C|nr:cadherin-related family member 4 [Rhineura floridana]
MGYSQALIDGIPGTVVLEDSVAPGTIVANFTGNCTGPSDLPTVTLNTTTPATSFFNQPNFVSPNIYEVSLSPSAALDAKEVNLYVLTFVASCPDGTWTEIKLNIRVTAAERLECGSNSEYIGENPVRVSENVKPGESIYQTVLKKRGTDTVIFTIENASLPFTITRDGTVLAPAEGFSREQADKIFPMVIVVTDSSGKRCLRPLQIEVLPVYHKQVNFTVSSVAKSLLENAGPLQFITQVNASGEHVVYAIISPNTNHFTIDPDTGIIQNTYNLDLERYPSLSKTQLVVKAYNMLHPSDSATITVNITVKRKNLQGPLCNPAVFVTEIPETEPIGTTLLHLSCKDVESGSDSLHYKIMEDSQSPQYSFQMKGSALQVNSTLDCDSEAMASLNFLYQATILVTDNGSSPQNTAVKVLVTVSRVNEYDPECSRWFFSVPENVPFGYFIGSVNGTDRDYPFDNIEYGILGAWGSVFYVGRRTGQLYVLGPLDYEKQKSYRLTVSLKDLDNDVNPKTQKTTLCNITINVQDVNDESPVCDPPFQQHFIYSTRTTSITEVKCEDKYERSELTYSIVGGNTNGRFRMVGNLIFHNGFSYNPDGVFDPLAFELLVEVTDSRSIPRFSTTATVIVYVTPWITTVPTTTTTTTTVPKEPIVLHRIEKYWAPDPWFVVVLTLTGALLLSVLGFLFWQLCWRKAPGETSQPLLQNKGKDLERNYITTEEPSKEKGKDSTEVLSLQLQFDGRAQDPITGQYYLFDSSTGARRWV